MGTPSFAVPSLRRLTEDGHEVVLAVTQADKPVGRRQILTPSPVKACALELGIPVFQPEKLRTEEAYETLRQAQADVFAVVAYGKILPQRILDLPRYGCINVHGSLLPKYRGAAPIQWAVIHGEAETGVMTMRMDAGLDTGDIYLTHRRPIPPDMTGGELYDALSGDGAALLSETLRELEAGTLRAVPQEGESTYAPMLDRSLSPLDFGCTAQELHNRIRGLNPWPAASCVCEGKRLKVFGSRVGGKTDRPAGTVVSQPLGVACGDGTVLEITELQAEGSRRMTAEEFCRGHAIAVGTLLT